MVQSSYSIDGIGSVSVEINDDGVATIVFNDGKVTYTVMSAMDAGNPNLAGLIRNERDRLGMGLTSDPSVAAELEANVHNWLNNDGKLDREEAIAAMNQAIDIASRIENSPSYTITEI